MSIAHLMIFLVVALLETIAFWKGDRILFFLSGFALLIWGFSIYQELAWLSILLVIAGVYNFARGVWA